MSETVREAKKAWPRVLTIAGSDSGGGAGIQADIKTFTVLETYGASVVTALTAQNTLGVHGVLAVDAAFVAAQLDAVLDDVGADAVKTGMLGEAAVVEAVAEGLARRGAPNLVVDPVMVAKSGDRLLSLEAVAAVRERLLPLAAVVTPNTEEAAELTGTGPVKNRAAMERAARALLEMGARGVLVKGGHLTDSPTSDDLWLEPGREPVWFEAPRYAQRHTHGTGCTLSAAIADHMARGAAPLEAVRRAKRFITEAVRTARPLGGGVGPVNHLFRFEKREDLDDAR